MPGDDAFDRDKSVFLAVLDRPADERDAALDTLCADDPALRARVVRLLTDHDRTASPLDRPPAWDGDGTAIPDPAELDNTDDPPIRPGERLGPYTILGPLGSGGMGVVFEARHAATGRLVALKLIRPDASSARARRRFEAEGRALARLRHPGIAQVYDAGVARPDDDAHAPPIPYIAMELVRGVPITDAAAELPRPERLRLIEQVCRAVHHAHLNGVVHRDLKPANVLVDEQGRPKVLDFGVAKLTEGDDNAPVTTHAGQMVGTPAYMSPEQLGADARAVDHRADIYALGAMLFETLAGRRPIDTDTADGLWSVLRRVEQGPPPLSGLDRALRGDLDVITAAAMRRDPAERYQSAAELADDLARHLRREPIHARPRTRRYVLGRFVRRNPLPIVLGAAAALAVMAGTTGITLKQREARAAEARAVARFNETRDLARVVLFDLEEAIARLPGSTRARHLLAATAQEYLDRLAADPAADDELRLEIAEGYLKLGEILGHPNASNLGDPDGALRNWRVAVEILQPLADRPDATARMLAAAGRATHAFNALYGFTSDPRELLEVARRSADLAARAARMMPDDPIIAIRRSESDMFMCSQLRNLGLHDEAVVMAHASIVSAEDCLARWPELRQSRYLVLEAHFWLGYMLIDAGLDGAETYLDRAEFVCQDILAADPADTMALNYMARIRGRQTHFAAFDGDAARAEERFNAARETWQSLVAADPDNQFVFRNLSVGIVQAGDSFRVLADTDPANRAQHLQTALDHYREGRDLLEQRIARGWLWPWESHYPEAALARIAACEQALAEASR